MLTVNKILCPTDFSEPSYNALSEANKLAKQLSAEIILVHVLSPAQALPSTSGLAASVPAGGGGAVGYIMQKIEGDALKSLEMTMKERIPSELKSKSILLQGNPAEEITKYAEEKDVNVIVMGTHGFTGWRHLLIGSVTERVVRISSCPVLTIPAS
jgi:nucleotide-binding universal stress UspA family protein